MTTAWVQTGLYDETLRVLRNKPEGHIGLGTKKVPVFGDEVWRSIAYVVEVTYTTGNTFGSESGNTAIACVCYSPETAMRIRTLLKENGRLSSPKYTLVVDGIEIDCGAWTGYFESIDNIDVKLVEVTES